ncbi:MAG TPA: M42 family metallopeptidase [Clostridia bacterium]|jgi:endoglucanase|nr:MAG: putative aminopeptidase YsdC [Firmicutes bacterium ADurb.Bin248]HOS18214.1 M42 family metallopeptidase [Clostridia bacterium]HPK15720.1 M42 family metallopeptidase [Clostridia bacterium]
MDTKTLETILTTYGPTGHEDRISSVLRDLVAPYADEVYNDKLGNLIALKRGVSGKKIMLSAHMDQIGLVVVAIDEKGFLRVANVGGVNAPLSAGHQVVFENGTRGAVYFERNEKGVGEVKMNNLFVDIGAESREEAEQLVNVGDMCVFAGRFALMGNRLSCSTLDDRICCAALVEAIQKARSEHDVYYVFTVQEEVGLRGAGTAAYAIEPDLGISLDVTGTGDVPEALPMAVELGKGPTVKVMDSSVIVPPAVRRFMENAAAEAGIPFQREVLRGGGTDTGAVQRTRGGVPAGCISIGTRYIHSPVETCDMRDYENAVKLLCACLERKELPIA